MVGSNCIRLCSGSQLRPFLNIIVFMKDEEKERAEENCEELSNAWNPDEGIALEWWGRAEGLSDEQ